MNSKRLVAFILGLVAGSVVTGLAGQLAKRHRTSVEPVEGE